MFKVVDVSCIFCESLPFGLVLAFRGNIWDFAPIDFPFGNGKPRSELDEAICRRWYSEEREGAREGAREGSEDGKRGAAMDTQDSSGGTAN